MIDVTGQPYVFANDNPLNTTDPLGLWPGQKLVHYILDVVAVPVFGVYYASYQASRGINRIGCAFGRAGCSHTLIAFSPLLELQIVGLAGDAGLDYVKNKLTGNKESVIDEGIKGGILPRFLFNGGPRMYLPGMSKKSGIVHFDIPW